MFAIFNNGLEIEMTMEQAQAMSHQGDCQNDVIEAMENGLADQLEGKEELIRSELSEYGAWDDNELQDVNENNMRILWLAAGNIVEGDYVD
jgi:hypothetical protein